MRIGNGEFRERWVDQAEARGTWQAVRQWREQNAPVPSSTVRDAVRKELEKLTGETWGDDYAVMLAALDLDIAQATEARKWIVHHFWGAIPVERRRGPMPVEGEDFDRGG